MANFPKLLSPVLLISIVVQAVLFSNCSNEPVQISELVDTVVVMTHEDSINKIRKEINAEEKTAKLKILFDSIYNKGLFNGNILVSQRGVVLYKNSYGYADFKSKDTLTTETVFQIASISKQFTAVAILKLMERGMISLEDPVQRFYPDFPYEGVTIKLLLSHRSGLMEYIYFLDHVLPNQQELIGNQQMMDSIISLKPQKYYSPDTHFDYTNTNYAILACIVEKVTGKRFFEFMNEEIFKPAGMSSTFLYHSGPVDTNLHIATGFKYNKTKAGDLFADSVWGDKGVYTTLDDLFKWDQSLYTEKLITRKTLMEAFVPRSHEFAGKRNYGYGWRTIMLEDSTILPYHRGRWQGFQSLLAHSERDTSCIIALGNKRIVYGINIEDVFNILYPDLELFHKRDSTSKHHSADSLNHVSDAAGL